MNPSILNLKLKLHHPLTLDVKYVLQYKGLLWGTFIFAVFILNIS